MVDRIHTQKLRSKVLQRSQYKKQKMQQDEKEELTTAIIFLSILQTKISA